MDEKVPLKGVKIKTNGPGREDLPLDTSGVLCYTQEVEGDTEMEGKPVLKPDVVQEFAAPPSQAMATPSLPRVDKTAFSVTSLIGGEADEKAYWLSRTPSERLEALELTRQIIYGYDPSTARLQRSLEIAELKTG